MEEKSNGVKENKNPDLYNQEWPKDAENYEFKTKQISCDTKNHKFRYMKRANEVKCDCGVGYLLGNGMDLKDGHIYYKENLVI